MDNTLVRAVLIGVVVSLLTHWLWQRRSVYKFAYQLPSTMWGIPILGCVLTMGRIDHVLTFLQNKWKCLKETTFCAFMAVTPIVFTKDPEVVKQILTQPEFLDKARDFYAPVTYSLGGGMLGLRGPKSLRHRKMLAPAFRPKQLLNFMDAFNSKGMEFVQHLNQQYEKHGSANDLLGDLRIYAIDITRMTTMGCNSETYEYAESLHTLQHRLTFAFQHVFWEIILACANLRWLIQYNPIYKYTKNKLYSVADQIISFRVKSMHSTDAQLKSESYLVIDQGYKYFKSGDIKWHEMVGEMNGILVASYETTSSTLYSALVLLAMHPEIQERLYEEIVSVFPSKDINVEYLHFSQLPYLEMVINESLRLFPPAPLIGREVTKQTTLNISEKSYELPSDMQIVIDIMSLHRDPMIWGPNAEKFDPDHFLPQNVTNRHPYAFIPFSKGARICFGWTYAYMVLKVLLVHILRNFRLSTTFQYEDIRVEIKLFLLYLQEPLLQLHRRP